MTVGWWNPVRAIAVATLAASLTIAGSKAASALGGALDPAPPPELVSPEVTVPERPNQAVGDVLGLHYEQVVRINGSRVEIAEPLHRGGAVLRSFEAGTRNDWPWASRPIPRPMYEYGGRVLAEVVGHEASRIAVLGDSIFVSNLLTAGDEPRGSVVRRYAPNGQLITERRFPNSTAVTALDGFAFGGRKYLAIGLNTGGVRVARADERGLPDFRELYSGEWTAKDRDQVTVVKLGADRSGRFLLTTGRYTRDSDAIVTADLRAERSDAGAGLTIWTAHPVGSTARWPDLIALGDFGADRTPMLAIAWPALGRVELLHAANGARWASSDGARPKVVRFYVTPKDDPRLAIRREGAAGRPDTATISGVDRTGDWYLVRELPDASRLSWYVSGFVDDGT